MRGHWKLVLSGCVAGMSLFFAFALGHSWHWLVFLAMLFSWIGDAMLAHFEPVSRRVSDPFIAGMGSFGVAQLLYCVAFYQSLSGMQALHMRVPGEIIGVELLPVLLPVYILVGLLYWVWTVFRSRQPWDLKGATLVYCLLLSTMAAFAACASFTGVSFVWQLMLGGLLFMISDGCIGAHIFRERLQNERRYNLIVWITYLPAQLLLVIGAARLY